MHSWISDIFLAMSLQPPWPVTTLSPALPVVTCPSPRRYLAGDIQAVSSAGLLCRTPGQRCPQFLHGCPQLHHWLVQPQLPLLYPDLSCSSSPSWVTATHPFRGSGDRLGIVLEPCLSLLSHIHLPQVLGFCFQNVQIFNGVKKLCLSFFRCDNDIEVMCLKRTPPWPGSSVSYNVTLIRQGCGFDPWSVPIQEATNE